jgi:hypothetical protein
MLSLLIAAMVAKLAKCLPNASSLLNACMLHQSSNSAACVIAHTHNCTAHVYMYHVMYCVVLQEGNGLEVTEGSTVTLQWVIRRSNGYFVDSSATHDYDPFIYR